MRQHKLYPDPPPPLLVVLCDSCEETTVARSPRAITLRGWRTPEQWPTGLPEWSRINARCPKCLARELPRAD